MKIIKSITEKNLKNGLNKIDIKKIMRKYNRCVYCGSNENLTLEHIIPVSKGGTNIEENLTMACNSCNCSKCDKDLLEWKDKDLIFDQRVLKQYMELYERN